MELSTSINLKLENDVDLFILENFINFKNIITKKGLVWSRVQNKRFKVLFKNGDILGCNTSNEVYDLLNDLKATSKYSDSLKDLYAIFDGNENVTGYFLVHF